MKKHILGRIQSCQVDEALGYEEAAMTVEHETPDAPEAEKSK